MPFLGLGLHIIVALFFAVHAVRTGQDRYWLMILFAFPGLGSVVYGLAIWLPDARRSRGGQQVVAGVARLLDPTRELRAAQDALDVAATPDNQLRLASALLDAGRASEAVVQYQAVMKGIYARDATLRVRLAHALLEAGKPGDARQELDTLIRENPTFKSPEGHLTYARALVALDDRPKAREEFEVLIQYFAGLEARAYYAAALVQWQDYHRAGDVITEALADARRMPKHSRAMNAAWLAQIKRLGAQLTRPPA
jgi:hypothetical protein